MNRVICLAFLLFVSGLLYAQQGTAYYTVKDRKATYEPHDKSVFYPKDSIKVTRKSTVTLIYHDSQSRMDGQIRVVKLKEAGTFSIKDYYSRGKALIGHGGSEKDGLTPAAAASPTKADEVLTAGIVAFLVHPDRPIFGCGAISAKRNPGRGVITVANQSENELFFDVIWIQDGGRCRSAQSFAQDFTSGYFLAPGETCELKIDLFAEKQTLYLVGTPDPIQYNRIDFTTITDSSTHLSDTYPLSIVKVE